MRLLRGPLVGPRLSLAVILLLIVVGSVVTVTSRADGEGFDRYVVGPPADGPESVILDPDTEKFYGGSSRDGTIYQATLDDQFAETFLPASEDGGEMAEDDGRTSAMGFDVDDGRLYVAGGSSGLAFVYDLESGELVARIDPDPPDPASGVEFLNGITVAPNGDVYVTDSNQPFVYRVSEEQIEESEASNDRDSLPEDIEPQNILLTPEVDYGKAGPDNSPNPLEANGIVPTRDGEYLLLNSLNNRDLYRLDPPDGDPEDDALVEGDERDIETVDTGGESIGDADGLELVEARTLLLADNNFDERLLTLELSSDFLEAEIVDEQRDERFETPTQTARVPDDDTVLLNNAEFFAPADGGDGQQPFNVLRVEVPALEGSSEDDDEGGGGRGGNGRSDDDDGGGSADDPQAAVPANPLVIAEVRALSACARYPRNFGGVAGFGRLSRCVTAGVAVATRGASPAAACRTQGLSARRRRGVRRSDLGACVLASRAVSAPVVGPPTP